MNNVISPNIPAGYTIPANQYCTAPPCACGQSQVSMPQWIWAPVYYPPVLYWPNQLSAIPAPPVAQNPVATTESKPAPRAQERIDLAEKEDQLGRKELDDDAYIKGVDALQKRLGFDDIKKQEYLDLMKFSKPKQFIEGFYKLATRDMGYGENAPKLALFVKSNANGEIVAATNTIYVNMGTFSSPRHFWRIPKHIIDGNSQKTGIAGIILHELAHFQHSIDVYRALGYEKLKEMGLKNLENDIEHFGYYSDEEIAKYRNFDYANYVRIGDAQGKILPGTKDYENAQKVFQEDSNYNYGDKGIADYEKQYVEIDAKEKASIFESP